MKGIVFSVERDFSRLKNEHRRPFAEFSLKRFFSLYGLYVFYISSFIFGIIFGALSFSKVDTSVFEQLDLLFMTNMEERMKLSAFEIFTASFASDFLFVFSAFLLSFTAWGIVTLPLLCAFRGYGMGLSSAFLFSQYSFSGIGFFILVILPGTVLFLFAFMLALRESFSHSLIVLKMYFPSVSDVLLLRHLKPFFLRYFVVMIFTVASALFDMMLWVLFANLFKFK